MSSYKGLYFDGLSSAAKTVELTLVDRINELQFVLPDGETVIWSIDNISYENYGDYLEIKHSGDRMAFLRTNDKDFNELFFEQLGRTKKLNLHHRFTCLSFPAIAGIAVFLFGLLIVSYLFVVPFIAEKAVAFIPISFDDYLGNEFMVNYLTDNSCDEEKSELLNRFAQQIEFNNVHELNFKVVESGVVNAFALPDGTVVVYTGLLDKMEGYEELVALLSHEVAHVNNRHSVKKLCRDLSGYLVISAILSDVNGIMAIIAENAHQLNSLSYSRKFEREADENGTMIMIENKINPEGMITLFSRLQEEEKNIIPQFLTTHPVTDKRIQYIRDYIDEHEHQLSSHSGLEKLFGEIKAD